MCVCGRGGEGNARPPRLAPVCLHSVTSHYVFFLSRSSRGWERKNENVCRRCDGSGVGVESEGWGWFVVVLFLFLKWSTHVWFPQGTSSTGERESFGTPFSLGYRSLPGGYDCVCVWPRRGGNERAPEVGTTVSTPRDVTRRDDVCVVAVRQHFKTGPTFAHRVKKNFPSPPSPPARHPSLFKTLVL